MLVCMDGAVHKVRHAIFGQFGPSSPVTLCHTSRDPPKVRHTSRTPRFFCRPSTKIPDKSPLYKFYLNCSQRFLSGGFVRVGFCPFLLLSQYICYNRKLNITLDFMFHIYMIKICISMTSHALDPLPLSHLLGPPPTPLSMTYFMDGPYALTPPKQKIG